MLLIDFYAISMILLSFTILKLAPLLHFRDASMKKTQPLSHFLKSMLKNDNPSRWLIFLIMRDAREMLFFMLRTLTTALDYTTTTTTAAITTTTTTTTTTATATSNY